jgi:hypothetical protein
MNTTAEAVADATTRATAQRVRRAVTHPHADRHLTDTGYAAALAHVGRSDHDTIAAILAGDTPTTAVDVTTAGHIIWRLRQQGRLHDLGVADREHRSTALNLTPTAPGVDWPGDHADTNRHDAPHRRMWSETPLLDIADTPPPHRPPPKRADVTAAGDSLPAAHLRLINLSRLTSLSRTDTLLGDAGHSPDITIALLAEHLDRATELSAAERYELAVVTLRPAYRRGTPAENAAGVAYAATHLSRNTHLLTHLALVNHHAQGDQRWWRHHPTDDALAIDALELLCAAHRGIPAAQRLDAHLVASAIDRPDTACGRDAIDHAIDVLDAAGRHPGADSDALDALWNAAVLCGADADTLTHLITTIAVPGTRHHVTFAAGHPLLRLTAGHLDPHTAARISHYGDNGSTWAAALTGHWGHRWNIDDVTDALADLPARLSVVLAALPDVTTAHTAPELTAAAIGALGLLDYTHRVPGHLATLYRDTADLDRDQWAVAWTLLTNGYRGTSAELVAVAVATA